MRKALVILFTFLASFAVPRLSAQDVGTYKFDFGVQMGMSGYLGDANGSSIFKHPGFAGGLSFRYLPNTRMAIRCVFNVLGLSGNTADFDNVLPGGAQYEFKSQVYELCGRYEFNFFPYGIGETYKHLRRWSPYLAAGIGVSLANCDGKTAIAPTIPMSVGVKYKLSERWNLAMEFSMTKALGDKIDGELDDLYQIQSSFIKNTDWYSNISISLTYEFGKRCVTCHYID